MTRPNWRPGRSSHWLLALPRLSERPDVIGPGFPPAWDSRERMGWEYCHSHAHAIRRDYSKSLPCSPTKACPDKPESSVETRARHQQSFLGRLKDSVGSLFSWLCLDDHRTPANHSRAKHHALAEPQASATLPSKMLSLGHPPPPCQPPGQVSFLNG